MLTKKLKVFSLDDLTESILKQSYLDKSFQVGIFQSKKDNLGHIVLDLDAIDSRWDKDLRQNYINSCATGNAATTLVFVDAKKCLENAESEKDKIYFQSILDKGFRYIVVDGWNRVVSILKFKHNLLKFAKTKRMFVKDSNKNVQFIEVSEPIDYKSLKSAKTPNESNLLYAIDNAEMYCVVVEEATRKDVSNLFLRVNDGKTLNGQEKRNGILNELADTIKQISEKNINSMSKLFSETDIVRLKFDDFIANCLLGYAFNNEKNISDTSKNKMYNDESEDNPAVRFLPKFYKDFTEFCKFISSNNTSKIEKRSLLFYDLFLLRKTLANKNIVIKNDKKFYDWFKAFAIKNIQSVKTYNIDEDPMTFDRMLRKNTSNILQYRMNMYLNDCYSRLLSTDVIAEYTPRSNSYQKFRYELWKKQDGYDAVSKEKIPLHEILDEKYHVDHIIPLSKNGSNDISNLRLVSREFNLMKSNKLDEELDAA